eukprot:2119910-Rhodomonas_salina.1
MTPMGRCERVARSRALRGRWSQPQGRGMESSTVENWRRRAVLVSEDRTVENCIGCRGLYCGEVYRRRRTVPSSLSDSDSGSAPRRLVRGSLFMSGAPRADF